jgi:hypothetical protein
LDVSNNVLGDKGCALIFNVRGRRRREKGGGRREKKAERGRRKEEGRGGGEGGGKKNCRVGRQQQRPRGQRMRLDI